MKRDIKILCSEAERNYSAAIPAQNGFSLVEVMFAMIIFLIAMLGIFSTFTFAVNYNAGNNARSQALVVMQQQVELSRSAKFTPTKTDTAPFDITGGTKTAKSVTSADGNKFSVQITVDDDPFCPGTQPEDAFCTTSIQPTTLKEIKIKVTLENPTPGWQTAVPAIVYLRRVRAN